MSDAPARCTYCAGQKWTIAKHTYGYTEAKPCPFCNQEMAQAIKEADEREIDKLKWDWNDA